MRGHWISGTRKLNRHYQSVGKKNLYFPDWDMYITTLLGRGVDDIHQQNAPSQTASLPTSIAIAENLQFTYNAKFSGGTGNLYLTFALFRFFTESTGTNGITVRYSCPSSILHQTGDRTLIESTYTRWSGTTGYGEKLLADTDGILSPQTSFVFDKSDLGIGGEKLTGIYFYLTHDSTLLDDGVTCEGLKPTIFIP